MTPKGISIIVSIIITAVGATAGAIWHFAPMELALANQEQIAMISKKEELSIFEAKALDIESECLDRKSGDWLCSDEEYQKYRKLKVRIHLLYKELGINVEGIFQ